MTDQAVTLLKMTTGSGLFIPDLRGEHRGRVRSPEAFLCTSSGHRKNTHRGAHPHLEQAMPLNASPALAARLGLRDIGPRGYVSGNNGRWRSLKHSGLAHAPRQRSNLQADSDGRSTKYVCRNSIKSGLATGCHEPTHQLGHQKTQTIRPARHGSELFAACGLIGQASRHASSCRDRRSTILMAIGVLSG